MSHLWNLKIKLKQEELAHLLEDYETAADQLNYTLDNVERSRLKRRLKALELQAQQVEQELHVMKQTQPPSSELLIELLKQHFVSVQMRLPPAYRACGFTGRMPTDVATLVAALEDAPQGLATYAVIDQFVAHLVSDRHIPEPTRAALRHYGEARSSQFAELLATLPTAKGDPLQPDDLAYIMVKLRLSQQDSTRSTAADHHYFVDVWVIPQWSQYDVETGLGCDRLDLPELMEHTYTLNDLPQVLEDCLIECAEVCSVDPIIELFFPLDLLNTPLEHWVIEGDVQPLCSQNVMVVRSSDRLSRRHRRRRAQWRQRWEALDAHPTLGAALISANCQQCGIDTAACLPNCGDPAEVDLVKAFGLNPSLVGLKFTLSCGNRDPYNLLNMTLQLGLPIALWIRHTPSAVPSRALTQAHQSQIDAILDHPWQQVQEQVKRQRIEAIGQPDHVGQHLSLLWENPYRLPPEVDYAS